MKKKDGILLIAVMAVAALLAIWMYLGQKQPGDRVCIMIDGEEYGSYSLWEEQIIEVKNERGYNRIVIAQGKVSMEEADCPDGYCVKHRDINRVNETIICLPHKLVVEIHAASQQDGIDSVAQ